VKVTRHTHRIREILGLQPQPVAGQVPVSDGNQGASWGDVPTLAEFNAIGWGQQAHAERTSDVTGITTADTDLTDLTVTLTTVAGRRYRLTAGVHAIIDSGDRTEFVVRIKEGATQLTQAPHPASTLFGRFFQAVVELEPSAGSHTYKVTGAVGGGTTGTGTLDGGATFPSFLTIDDVGPQ
jgi:hypothetical protein